MSVDVLKSLISQKGGYARSNLFRVVLPPPNKIGAGEIITTDELNILATSVNLPFKQIDTMNREVGPKMVKIARNAIYDDISVNFLVLNDYAVKKYFDAWQNLIVNENFEVNYYKNYARQIYIDQLNSSYVSRVFGDSAYSNYYNPEKFTLNGLSTGGDLYRSIASNTDEIIYRCILMDAYPSSVSDIKLSNEKNGMVELSVQFSYRKWEDTTDKKSWTVWDGDFLNSSLSGSVG